MILRGRGRSAVADAPSAPGGRCNSPSDHGVRAVGGRAWGDSGNWGTGLHDIFPWPDRGNRSTRHRPVVRRSPETEPRVAGGAVRRAFPDQGPRTRRHEVHSDKSRNAFLAYGPGTLSTFAKVVSGLPVRLAGRPSPTDRAAAGRLGVASRRCSRRGMPYTLAPGRPLNG